MPIHRCGDAPDAQTLDVPEPPGASYLECQMEGVMRSFDLGFLYLVIPALLAVLAALLGGE